MAVYDADGNALTAVYDADGNPLSYAYDADGNTVYHPYEPAYDYDNYSVSATVLRLSGSDFQGFAIHNGIIAQFQANDMVSLVSVTGEIIASQLACSSYHGNSAFFTDQYYEQGDEFPLLVVMGSYTMSWINRITRNGCTMLKAIYIPTTAEYGGYKLGNAYDADTGHMYTLGYTNKNYTTDDGGANKLILAVWNLNNLTDNGDDTYTPHLIRTVQHDFLPCIQGCGFFNSLIWASSSIGGQTGHIYAIDPATFEIKHTITLDTVEIEGCYWVGSDYLLVGQRPSNIYYKKVTFAEVY